MVRVSNKLFGTKSYFLGLGGVKYWWNFSDHESMIHDNGDQALKIYYLIWDKISIVEAKAAVTCTNRLHNRAMIANDIIHMVVCMAHRFWPNTIKANLTN